MNYKFKYIFTNTLQSFLKSKTCWFIFFFYTALMAGLIVILPKFYAMHIDADVNYPQNLLSSDWVPFLSVLNLIPMAMIFTIITSLTFNFNDNTYILTRFPSRFQLFFAKFCAQFLILLIFIIVSIVFWIILWSIALQRKWNDTTNFEQFIYKNIFDPRMGFTLGSIIICPILVAICCIVLGGVFQYLFKSGLMY